MKDNFSKNSADYAAFRPEYPAAVYPYIFSFCNDKTAAWDCGTGNGQVAKVLADNFTTVVATDISANQIQNAVTKDNLHYSIQPAEQTDFDAASFDLITVAQAIHWFDFDAFYAEVRRTSKKEGVLAVLGYGVFSMEGDTNAILQHFYKDIIGPYWDAERKYIDDHYTTIPFPFEDLNARTFENTYSWTIEDLMGYLSTWSAVQHYKTKNGKDPVALIFDDLQKSWGPNPKKKANFPILLRIAKINQ